MRWRTVLKFATFMVSAITGGTVVALAIADFNDYRPEIAAAIEMETGHRAVFGGDIGFSWGRTATLTIADLRLANSAEGGGADKFRAAEATLEVATWPLLNGDIVIQRLFLRSAELLIDIDDDGRTNFDDAVPAAQQTGDGSRHGKPLLLRSIEDIEVRDANVTIRDARRGEIQQFSLRRLRLHDANTDGLMRVAATGTFRSDGYIWPFDFKGRAGRLAALIEHKNPYPIDLQGTLGDVSLKAAGTIAEPFAAKGLALRIDASAESLLVLSPLFGTDLPPVGPSSLTATLTGSPERLSFADALLAMDGSQLTGDLTIDRSGDRLGLHGKLSAEWLDLTPWWFSTDQQGPDRDSRVLNNERLPLEKLGGFDGEFTVVARTLLVPGLVLHDTTLSFALKHGRLTVSRAQARLDDRPFSGELTVDSRATPPAVSLQLTAPDFDVGRTVGRLVEDEVIRGTGGMALSIDGHGWSAAEIVGSASGNVRFLMDAGEVKTGSLDLLVGGVSELLPALGRGSGDWTAINCLAGDFGLRSGILTSQIALLDSEVLRLVGEGQLDLENDTIDFYVAPSPKNPTLNLALPVNLSGSLHDPSITPDELSILRRLGGLVSAIVFPPAALLSFGSLGNHDNPCLKAVQSAELPEQDEPINWSDHPEADAPPVVSDGSADRLIDAVRQLLPLRGSET